jgi:hypothetical protein
MPLSGTEYLAIELCKKPIHLQVTSTSSSLTIQSISSSIKLQSLFILPPVCFNPEIGDEKSEMLAGDSIMCLEDAWRLLQLNLGEEYQEIGCANTQEWFREGRNRRRP